MQNILFNAIFSSISLASFAAPVTNIEIVITITNFLVFF